MPRGLSILESSGKLLVARLESISPPLLSLDMPTGLLVWAAYVAHTETLALFEGLLGAVDTVCNVLETLLARVRTASN